MTTGEPNPPLSDDQRCPQCGAPLVAGSLAGLCPACLLKQGAAADTVSGAPHPPFEPPSAGELAPLFPQLDILELIGKGGMGAVYKARQKELDRIVALKILPRGLGDAPGFAERFAREAKALAKLNHPGIVTIHEFGRADGLFYFLMEFVDGVNLRQLLAGGRVSPREALAIVPEICDALQFAHDHGIVHRDIKPANILLDRRGRVKVADFGLAKLVAAGAEAAATAPGSGTDTSFTGAGKIMGTPPYMAPEQTDRPDEVDHRADIYSLGVVFYELLTGELPAEKFPRPSSRIRGMHVDVRLDEVVLRALEKEPGLRYQQATQFKTQVEGVATPSDSVPRADAEEFAREILARSYVLDIGSCLRRGWEFVKSDFWPVMGVTAIMLLLVGSNGGAILGGPLVGGFCLYILNKMRGAPVSVATAFSGFTIAFMPLFVAGLIIALATILGFLCFILPGILVAAVGVFPLALVIDKRLDFSPAMELTWKKIRQQPWKFIQFILVVALLNLAGLLVFGVGLFFTAPITFAAMMYAYEDIFSSQSVETPAEPVPVETSPLPQPQAT